MSDKPCFYECAEDATGGELRYAVVRWDTWRGSVAHRQGMPETIARFPHSDLGRILAEDYCRKMEAQK